MSPLEIRNCPPPSGTATTLIRAARLPDLSTRQINHRVYSRPLWRDKHGKAQRQFLKVNPNKFISDRGNRRVICIVGWSDCPLACHWVYIVTLLVYLTSSWPTRPHFKFIWHFNACIRLQYRFIYNSLGVSCNINMLSIHLTYHCVRFYYVFIWRFLGVSLGVWLHAGYIWRLSGVSPGVHDCIVSVSDVPSGVVADMYDIPWLLSLLQMRFWRRLAFSRCLRYNSDA